MGVLLGMTAEEVHLAGVADKNALRARVEAAGGDWETGRPKRPPPSRAAVLEARRAVGEALAPDHDDETIEERRERQLRELRDAAAKGPPA